MRNFSRSEWDGCVGMDMSAGISLGIGLAFWGLVRRDGLGLGSRNVRLPSVRFFWVGFLG